MYSLCFFLNAPLTTSRGCLVNWTFCMHVHLDCYECWHYSNTIQTLTTHVHASREERCIDSQVFTYFSWSMSKVLNIGMHFKIPGWTMTKLFFLWQSFHKWNELLLYVNKDLQCGCNTVIIQHINYQCLKCPKLNTFIFREYGGARVWGKWWICCEVSCRLIKKKNKNQSFLTDA